MLNHDYLIDTVWCDSGGYCDVMPIKGHKDLVFKSFKYEHKAKEAYNNQVKLSKLDLAPRVLSKLCKIAYYFDHKVLSYWNPANTITDLGFISEKTNPLPVKINLKSDQHKTANKKYLKSIQDLVNLIYAKTELEFWDSHIDNVGYLTRKNRKKLVCIDTGQESFNKNSNIWNLNNPGPQCLTCFEYYLDCKC